MEWWEEECFRASGAVVCSACGKLYYDHPQVTKECYLIRGCDGRLYKL